MIRPMKRLDKETVMDFLKETDMFTPAELIFAEEQIDIYLDRHDQRDYSIVVCEDENNQVVGYLSYGPTPLTEGTYDLYWMAVSPKYQGRGYGKEMVSWLESQVRKDLGRLILIETSSQPKYHPTRQFYLRLGYTEVARIVDFYKPGDDRITYVKHFNQKELKRKNG